MRVLASFQWKKQAFVYKRYKRFQSGQEDVKDDQRLGLLSILTTKEFS